MNSEEAFHAEEKKRLVIAGSSGFIGTQLLSTFKDWAITTLDRVPRSDPGIESVNWDGRSLDEWVDRLDGADALINLSGSPISVKWDEQNKASIISSRVDSSRALGEAMSSLKSPPLVWVNGSAVGYYGDRQDTALYESAEAGEGFLSEVCRSWERTATETVSATTRLVLMRTGFVLGRNGGALKPLQKLAMFGLGGAAGSGSQWIPWIHIEDLGRLFRWVVENERIAGPVNGCAPEPVRNRDFMARLRHELNRPWSPPAPAFAIKLLGEFTGPDAELLLGSQRALPRVAIDSGFTWTYPNIGEALANLTKRGAFVA